MLTRFLHISGGIELLIGAAILWKPDIMPVEGNIWLAVLMAVIGVASIAGGFLYRKPPNEAPPDGNLPSGSPRDGGPPEGNVIARGNDNAITGGRDNRIEDGDRNKIGRE